MGIVFLDFDRLGLNGFPDLRLGNPNGRFKTPDTSIYLKFKLLNTTILLEMANVRYFIQEGSY
jgi:hypothetical protein